MELCYRLGYRQALPSFRWLESWWAKVPHWAGGFRARSFIGVGGPAPTSVGCETPQQTSFFDCEKCCRPKGLTLSTQHVLRCKLLSIPKLKWHGILSAKFSFTKPSSNHHLGLEWLNQLRVFHGFPKLFHLRLYHQQLALLEDLQRGLHAGLGRHLPKSNVCALGFRSASAVVIYTPEN